MNLPQVKVDYFPLQGGWDLETPPLIVSPGKVQDAENYYCDINGGYTRVGGYERFDGRPSPSDALYQTLPATITGSWALGDTVTGVTSAATAVVLATSSAGFIVTKVSGTFVAAENLQISAVTIATCDGASYAGGADSMALDATYLNLAADEYRSDIQAVPGNGQIRGVWEYNDTVYAFRDDGGPPATSCKMYKSTTGGWTVIALGYEMSFNTGAVSWADGQTVTQGGASATIARVVIESGSVSGGDAAGRLVFASVTGGPFAAGAITSSGGGTATAVGAESAITMLPGGAFKFQNYNFGGSDGTRRMYGCDGINRGFEFDGTTFVPIDTGMSSDKPNLVACHKNHLFFAFGASLQFSGTGFPYQWTPVLGAGEIALGDTITALIPQPGSETNAAMYVPTRGQARILYGNSSADWNLVTIQQEGGALANTAQPIGQVYALDDRGIIRLGTTQNYGNFESASISAPIQQWVRAQRTKAIASSTSKENSQYRLFFSDGYALYTTLSPNGVLGMMPMLFPNVVRTICVGEFSDGTERSFFGSDDGYIYEIDKGSSFDGANISARLKLVFNHIKSPRLRKRYRKLVFEIAGSTYASFTATYDLGYSSTDIAQDAITARNALTASLSSFVWDAFSWDAFFWDGRTLAPSELDITGTAENIAVMVQSDTDEVYPFTISGVIIQWTPRRQLR